MGELASREEDLIERYQNNGSAFVDFEAEMSDDEGHSEDDNEDGLEEELVGFDYCAEATSIRSCKVHFKRELASSVSC